MYKILKLKKPFLTLCTIMSLSSHLQSDVQRAVHCRFMDQSTSVREAAIELVGRFVLMQHSLTSQYYDMLLERILVSVFILVKYLHDCALCTASGLQILLESQSQILAHV